MVVVSVLLLSKQFNSYPTFVLFPKEVWKIVYCSFEWVPYRDRASNSHTSSSLSHSSRQLMLFFPFGPFSLHGSFCRYFLHVFVAVFGSCMICTDVCTPRASTVELVVQSQVFETQARQSWRREKGRGVLEWEGAWASGGLGSGIPSVWRDGSGVLVRVGWMGREVKGGGGGEVPVDSPQWWQSQTCTSHIYNSHTWARLECIPEKIDDIEHNYNYTGGS